jgi:hypothetical protein
MILNDIERFWKMMTRILVACMAGGFSQACPILGTACHAG